MIRQKVKAFLTSRCDREYETELESKVHIYDNWFDIHRLEIERMLRQKDHSEGEKLSCGVVRFSHLKNYISSGEQYPDIIIACDDEGKLADYAETMIRDFFAEHQDICMVYGDEDRIDGEFYVDPWMKPDWSPDTFLSTFYFGSVFAFRSSELVFMNPGGLKNTDYESRSALEEDIREENGAVVTDLDDAMSAWIYGKLCLKLAQAEGGYTRRFGGHFPIGHIPEILFHRTKKPVMWDSRLIKDSLTGRYSRESASMRLVSIIIPSKDNPEILLRCIKSIEKFTENTPYELIVVDNGSNEANRAEYEGMLKKHERIDRNGSTSYLYEKQEFNFSKMCNRGAQTANGELLLFLNDDVEIRRPGWLSYLSEKAKLPYVGAVGMKLLYPNSDIIQHAGVMNLRVGPVHKLQYQMNTEEHYFGFNKGVRNVMAVTGACLMVRSELFREVGGFDEEKFAVAFNDVDLCYKFYELGYYNVVRNNMYLYHHESLSRGDDRKDEVKSMRLTGELNRLLRAHPDLHGVDPFYGRYLSQNPAETRFVIDVEEEIVNRSLDDTARPEPLAITLKESWLDPVLRLGVEYANSLDEWYLGPFTGTGDRPHSSDGYHDRLYPERTEETEKEEKASAVRRGYYVRGYSFVIDADNAVYRRTLLLRSKDSGKIYTAPVQQVCREDIADHLTGQIHDEMTGFFVVLEEDGLPEGEYTVGMMVKDRTSRQRLFNWSDVTLRIGNTAEAGNAGNNE